jgi:hypothetical protein
MCKSSMEKDFQRPHKQESRGIVTIVDTRLDSSMGTSVRRSDAGTTSDRTWDGAREREKMTNLLHCNKTSPEQRIKLINRHQDRDKHSNNEHSSLDDTTNM